MRFQIEQAALDEQLHRRDGQADARGLHHRLHAGIDQEVLVELLHAVEAVLVHDVGHQRIALALAQLVEDRLGHALPGLRLEARLDRLLQVAGDLEALLGRRVAVLTMPVHASSEAAGTPKRSTTCSASHSRHNGFSLSKAGTAGA